MILTYHEVFENDSRYLYSVTPAGLDSHLAVVAEVQRCNAESFGGTLVTFDDGHLSNYDLAFPLLQKHKVFATFFVTTEWIAKRPSFMGWRQLREMQQRGHTIGAHGVSHKFLTHCSSSELQDEVRRSKRTIEDALGIDVVSISMPGGRWNRRVVEVCHDAGYLYLYHSDASMSERRVAGIKVQGRLMVHRGTSTALLRRYLLEDSRSLLTLRLKNRLTAGCRRILGDSVYERAWRLLASKEHGNYV